MQLKSGAFVALSWPDTKVKNASSFYDGPMSILGLCKDGYYQLGHAALLLIDYRNGNVRYFDFGRYHTPFGFGRVRDFESDPELEIKTKAKIKQEKVINIKDILQELDGNKSTHGDGKLVASLTPGIDYDLAYASAKSLQGKEAIPYGPFQPFGTNCSRFVAKIYKSGFTSYFKKQRIFNRYLYFHSPTSNIIFTHTKANVFIIEQGQFRLEDSMMNIFLNKSKFDDIPKESKNDSKNKLPDSVFCLSGTGGDTYFQINKTNKSHLFRIRRYSEYGELEIDDLYKLETLGFNINKAYEFSYISNGISVKLKQRNKIFKLHNLKYQGQKSVLTKTQKRKIWNLKIGNKTIIS